MREPYKDLLEETEVEVQALRSYLKEANETIEVLKEYFMDAMGQGCGNYNREKEIMEYDHMCMSTWEHMTDYALQKGWIKKEQVTR